MMIEEVMMVAGVLAEVVSVAVVMIVMVMEALEVPGGMVLINVGCLCAAHKP